MWCVLLVSSSNAADKPGGNIWYLQKTLPGGIMLVELRFRDVFFCVSVYAYEWRPVSDGRKVNSQVIVHFCALLHAPL